MTRLSWDTSIFKPHELGVDKGVLYTRSSPGEVWNGLTAVTEAPSFTGDKTRFIDGIQVRHKTAVDEFEGSIEAFTYPEALYEFMFGKAKDSFDMCYRINTDTSYKLHLVYNVYLHPSTKTYSQKETSAFGWDFTTKPVAIPEAKSSSHIVIDAAVAYPATVDQIEELLYGSDTAMSRMPLPKEVVAIFEANSILRVTDHGDGTFTVTGPDSAIRMIDTTTFEINWSSAVPLNDVSYRLSSL